jgi:glycosyltransferase involved in cell wall biosynthesis
MTAPRKIILLVIDTLRADHLGCYDYERDTSPNIDRLAAHSIFFSHAFTPVSYTLPAIASLLTSKRPDCHGIGLSQTGKLSEDSDLTLAEVLRDKGYATAAFVSTIVLSRATRLNLGFDLYDDEVTTGELNRPDYLLRDGQETIARALEYIKHQKENSLFTFIHLMDVHGPYICPPPYDSLFIGDSYYGEKETLNVVPDNHPCQGIPGYQVLGAPGAAMGDYTGLIDDVRYYRARYDGCIRKCDAIVARLLDGLKTLGIYDDTLFILTADHGEALGENGIFFFHGVTVTPEQIHVPLIIKPQTDSLSMPKKLATHISTMDLMPTILSACGIDFSDLDLHGSPLQTLIEKGADSHLSNRTLLSVNECQDALISPNETLELQRSTRPFRGHYAFVPELIDRLNGSHFNWKTGGRMSIAAALRKSKMLQLRQEIHTQPLSARKLERIVYLLGSIALPLAAKRRIMSLRFSRLRYQAKSNKQAIRFRSGYQLENSEPIVSQAKPYTILSRVPTCRNRPRVLHAIANFCTGGSSRLVVDLIERLGDAYEQEVLTSFMPTPPAFVGVRISEIRRGETVEAFLARLSAFDPAIVHMHYWGDGDYSWYEKVIRAAERYGCRIIQNINTPVTPYFSEAVNRYVYVSNYVWNHFGRRDTKSMVIYPGSNFELFARSENAPIAHDCIGMVYRLETDKLDEHSIDPFVAVVKKRPSTRALIVGGGTLLSSFQASVQRAGVETQFRFTGYVAYEDLPQLYCQMAVFVAPIWQESFGQVTPFAMHMGLPVVGYNTGALSEILGNRDLLAPVGNSEAMADLIVRLLDNPEKRISIGQANRRRAATHFSIENMVDKYRSLYAEVIGKRNPSGSSKESLPVQSKIGIDLGIQAEARNPLPNYSHGLKVALFVHCFFPSHFYGTETYTLQVAEHLQRMGHKPVVVSAVFQEEPKKDKLITHYFYRGIPVYCIDKNFAPHSCIKETYYQESLRTMFRDLLQEIRPDLVHVTHLINHTAVLLEVADELGLPTVATMTDFFGICFNNRLQAVDGSQCNGPNAGRTNCIACLLKANRGRLIQLIANWPRPVALGLSLISRVPFLRRNRLTRIAEDLKMRPDILTSCYAKYRATIVPTRFLHERYVANGLRAPCFQSSFGVDLPRDPKPQRPDGRPIAFGFIGQIAPHKGTDLLVEAFTRLPHGAAILYVYGPKDQDAGFMANLQRIALGHAICFEGTFPSQKITQVLRDLDVLVIPSRWSENSPLVLLDALSTHTPVIVSDTGGLTEVVEDGRNGFRFAVGSVDALEQALRRFIEDPKLAARLSLSTEYPRTTRTMVEDVLKVYEFALDGISQTRTVQGV